VTLAGIEEGAFLFAKGWLVKGVADALGSIADRVYADPGAQPEWMPLWGLYAFAFQLYGDFLGYSEMARGVARGFGFRLSRNFAAPYFASDVRNFWARWHMTLTDWMRDYVFHPLGGTRRGPARTAVHLLILFVLLGVWHGAGWNYAVWGVLYGSVMVFHALVLAHGSQRRERWLAARPLLQLGWRLLSVLVTFHLFTLSGIVFRAQANDHASMLENIQAYALAIAELPWRDFEAPPTVMWMIAIPIVFDLFELRRAGETWSPSWPWGLRGTAIGVMCAAAIAMSSAVPRPFVYFQF
jgi:D-alanyl-lipoteichoic acid acyltransferase DltB (MBOAT superfamily)